MIAHAQMITFGFDVRVDHLKIEKLRVLRPVPTTRQSSWLSRRRKRRELALLVQAPRSAQNR